MKPQSLLNWSVIITIQQALHSSLHCKVPELYKVFSAVQPVTPMSQELTVVTFCDWVKQHPCIHSLMEFYCISLIHMLFPGQHCDHTPGNHVTRKCADIMAIFTLMNYDDDYHT